MTDLGDKLKAMRAAREAAGEEFLDWDEIRAYKEGWLDECRELKSLRADNERLRGLLREARQRTQNLLHRQHGDAIIMNPDEYLRATLSWLDDALAESGHESGQNGPSAADQPAAAQCDHAWVYSDLARDWNCTKCGRSGITADNAAAQPDAGPQAPIIRVSVDEFGSARVVKHYAPGLPFGEHELYCEPEATAPIIREEPDAAPKPKRAYHETHEPPHCPTCECWQEITPDNSPAGQEG